ncbi:MAG: PEP-CTERM sorting domain-containing protein [Phycisphaerales bacterium]|nr:PEP-CTERM sorting domain-containing protein [Phycisphaerales bacterium]
MKTMLAVVAACGCAAIARADIVVETYGTAPRPGRVFGVPTDPTPYNPALFTDVTSTPAFGGSILFSVPVSVRQVGSGWATWSGGYTGNVYYTNGATSLTLTYKGLDLDWFIGAQVYAEPNPFAVFDISATATDSSGAGSVTLTQAVDGNGGACGWGFYTPASFLRTVTISSDVDFAVGDLATVYFIPAPGSIVLLGAAAMSGSRRRR